MYKLLTSLVSVVVALTFAPTAQAAGTDYYRTVHATAESLGEICFDGALTQEICSAAAVTFTYDSQEVWTCSGLHSFTNQIQVSGLPYGSGLDYSGVWMGVYIGAYSPDIPLVFNGIISGVATLSLGGVDPVGLTTMNFDGSGTAGGYAFTQFADC